jgi:hypothetical protein
MRNYTFPYDEVEAARASAEELKPVLRYTLRLKFSVPYREAYPLEEVSQLMGGISVPSLRRLIARGKLRTVPHTGRVLVSLDEIRRFVNPRK